MTKKEKDAQREEARASLRELLKPGDTVSTVLRRVSASGMSRSISPVICGEDGPTDLTWLVIRALDENFDRKNGGVKVGGCGMDMGFHLVYNLSSVLFPAGFSCIGDGGGKWAARCPACDHSNGDRDYTPHQHKDGGYALRQAWI